ncbi:MAG TPA: hypothetical protein VMN37_10880 [Gemmatimonadales bacterium]|nr:hypothetical protein [Gemmatimonadales bacterium]
MSGAQRKRRRAGPAGPAAAVLFAACCSPLAAQTWDAPDGLALVHRAIDRRSAARTEASLESYRTRAHGFVFFLAQVGAGLSEPPRLVKADELAVEVYWQAPDRSKQVILGWRDGAFLPTDIAYHRDHLGIVTNDFGDMIRIGEGDEVRDVVHPLSPAGPALYQYAGGDSLSIRTAAGHILVREVQVRPRSFARPLVVGTMYLDDASAALVRFRFSFTPAAYLDRQLEDISIVLENALFEGRYWLPHRQEVEIRRRTTWLDFPARGIIRGRWEIDAYDLNVPLPAGSFGGAPIGGLAAPGPGPDSAWTGPLSEAIAEVAEPLNRQDMDALRVEVERIAGARALGGLPARRLAAGSLSDLVRVNRVQGLTLGFGAVAGLERQRIEVRPYLAYGTSDDRITGTMSVALSAGATRITLGAGRRIRDFSDLPVVAPALNSILAQEGGRDYGDYVLLHSAGLGLRHRMSGRTSVGLDLEVEESRSVRAEASPATGRYRPNPALGSGTYRLARLALERASGGIAMRRDLQGRLALEGGEGPTEYLRATAEGRWLAGLGRGTLLSRLYLGAGTDGLPAHRSFALGGRGTLVGEPFRAFGGRTAALVHAEWRVDLPAPAIRLGSFATTGRTVTLAPFVAVGYTERPVEGLPGRGSAGVRPVAGLAAEWFMRLLRTELGVGLRDGRVGITVDVSRDWWGVL